MVDPKAEAPLRKILGHIMRGETEDALKLADEIGPRTYESAVALAIAASGYIAISASERWPREVDIRELAKYAATTRGSQVTESEISDYLSRVVLGSDNPLDVFEGNRAAIIPLFATAVLLVTYSRGYADQWEYLDAIWNAIDAADQLEDDVLPAATFRFARK